MFLSTEICFIFVEWVLGSPFYFNLDLSDQGSANGIWVQSSDALVLMCEWGVRNNPKPARITCSFYNDSFINIKISDDVFMSLTHFYRILLRVNYDYSFNTLKTLDSIRIFQVI